MVNFKNIFKLNKTKVSDSHQKYIDEINKMSNEDAINNYIKEINYYRKAKAVEEKVVELLDKYHVTRPVLMDTSDYEVKKAKKILEIKGLVVSDNQLEEIVVRRQDIEAGIHRAWIGIESALKYYGSSEDAIKSMAEKFQAILEDETLIKYDLQDNEEIDSFSKKYSLPEIFDDSDIEEIKHRR